MTSCGALSVLLAVDWAAVGAIAGIAGVVSAVAVPIALQRRSKAAKDRQGAEGAPQAVDHARLTAQQIAELSQRLTEYAGVTYDMDLELKSPEGRKRNFTPEYMDWARCEDRLRSEMRLMLDPTKPEQARLLEAIDALAREGDVDAPWIERRDRLLAVAQQVYAAELAQAG